MGQVMEGLGWSTWWSLSKGALEAWEQREPPHLASRTWHWVVPPPPPAGPPHTPHICPLGSLSGPPHGHQGAPIPPPLLVWPGHQAVGGNWRAACRGRPTVDRHSRSKQGPSCSCTCWPGPSPPDPARGGVHRGSWPSKGPQIEQTTPQMAQGEGKRGLGWGWTPRTTGAGVAADSTVEGTASQPVVAPPVLWTLHPYVGAQSTRTPQSRVLEVLDYCQAAPEPPPPGSLPIQWGPPAYPDTRPQSSGTRSRTGARNSSGPAQSTRSDIASRQRREHRRGFRGSAAGLTCSQMVRAAQAGGCT